jgi:hypothetical protein
MPKARTYDGLGRRAELRISVHIPWTIKHEMTIEGHGQSPCGRG